jgi:RNA polymerase sporulation-specific sigma factor
MWISISHKFFGGGSMVLSENNRETDELIDRVRKGDNSAFELLLCKYTPLIEAAVSKTLIDEDSYSLYADDFRQEATVIFYNSILTYDMEQHEVEFGLYAKICISNALISQLRKLSKRNTEHLSATSEDGLFINDSENDPSVRILEQESLSSLYSAIRGNLSELEYRIWRLYMSGRTANQIGCMVDKDEKSVTNAIYRIRKKLRALLQE